MKQYFLVHWYSVVKIQTAWWHSKTACNKRQLQLPEINYNSPEPPWLGILLQYINFTFVTAVEYAKESFLFDLSLTVILIWGIQKIHTFTPVKRGVLHTVAYSFTCEFVQNCVPPHKQMKLTWKVFKGLWCVFRLFFSGCPQTKPVKMYISFLHHMVLWHHTCLYFAMLSIGFVDSATAMLKKMNLKTTGCT